MLNKIISELGDNYSSSDKAILDDILDRATTNALFISNRSNTPENIYLLSDEIIQCVKTIYLQRGSEDVTGQSESGINNTYKDSYATLRNDIVKNGKRKCK